MKYEIGSPCRKVRTLVRLFLRCDYAAPPWIDLARPSRSKVWAR